MTKKEMKEIVTRVDSGEQIEDVNLDVFIGCGTYGFEPIVVTMKAMVAFVRYQCMRLDGTLDLDALNEIWEIRRNFLIVG